MIKRHKIGATLALGGLLLAVGTSVYLASRARPAGPTAERTAAAPTPASDREPANGMAVLLRDEFDDGDIGTNSAPGVTGGGFELRAIAGSGSVVEADGAATISGTATIKYLQSKDAFEPVGKTMTWVISKRSSVATFGVAVGWVQANKAPCCDPNVMLGIEGNRVVFDLQAKRYDEPFQSQGRYVDIPLGSTAPNAVYTNPGSPITATVYVDTTRWKIDITGDGVDIHQSGDYQHCPKPVKGSCISLNDVLVHPGELVFADYDGIVVIPRAVEQAALQQAKEKVGKESSTRAALVRGETLRDVYDRYGVL
jgi:hypothetical protein